MTAAREGVLARAAAIYAVMNVVQRVLPVVFFPVLTHFLTPAELGVVAVFAALVRLATPFVGVNATYSINRRYFDADREGLPAYLGTALLVLAAGTLVATAVVGALSPRIALDTGLPAGWAVGAVGVAAGEVLLGVRLVLWQAQHRAAAYGWLQVARTTLDLGLALALVVGLGWGFEGPLAATAVATAVLALGVAAPSLRPRVRLRLDRAALRHLLSYGGGLIPHTLGAMAIVTIDRFFVTHYAGAAETGVYFMGYQVGLVVGLAADAFNRAWTPWLYEGLLHRDPARDRRIVRLTYAAFAALAALAGLVTLVAPWIIDTFLAETYRGAAPVVGWIAAGFAFNGAYKVVSGHVFYGGRTLVISAITALAAGLNIGLNALLVPRYGAVGAAQATAAAFLASFLLTWLVATRTHRLPWRGAA